MVGRRGVGNELPKSGSATDEEFEWQEDAIPSAVPSAERTEPRFFGQETWLLPRTITQTPTHRARLVDGTKTVFRNHHMYFHRPNRCPHWHLCGMVPSIQYDIADFHHYAILGNVFFYIGLAIPPVFFWPLLLLHGRKPYILASMPLAMPFLFPQPLAVSRQRGPYVATYRVGLILPRAFMGTALEFANMNSTAPLPTSSAPPCSSANPIRNRPPWAMYVVMAPVLLFGWDLD